MRPSPAFRSTAKGGDLALTGWDPGQYLRYGDERLRPFIELIARIPLLDGRPQVVDLGCGPGNTTAVLLERWPAASVVGVDSSPAMIGAAGAVAAPPQLTFVLGDMTTWEPNGPVDVVVANAALHWVPGHTELFGRWLGWLRPGGILAFQVPGNDASPTHARLRALASSQWSDRLGAVADRADVLTPRGYYEALRRLGAEVDARETTYCHVLTGPDPVLEWVKGTALRPYLAALEPEQAGEFEAAYAAALREAYPPSPGGETVRPRVPPGVRGGPGARLAGRAG
ncbi:MAG: methyltransferase domain-containing protein [Actinomycetota bacterium]